MQTANANAEVINDNVVSANAGDVQRDEFGRDEAERTVILGSRDAEAINREVEAGKHDSYDDALTYVIARGLAEIKRQRDAAEANRQKSRLKAEVDSWKKMLELNPALVTDPNVVSKMMQALGVLKTQSK
jgi:hypothetical protein